ncbi:DNA replication ATP-dependent helicase/nuclease DNA2 [Anopheles coustani]|uniref:DNA replication ATP-dependent helicase/nuclease DNA2 n=1 Tax=Anopheles coustani TaxID=139045 RepID=UPI00265A2F7A|nr:DNA replication ATP-dependent helicase/nuclease DNA2 [Anopheles coustani]
MNGPISATSLRRRECQQYTLDLTKWQRCKVLTVERCANHSLLVLLEHKRSKEKAKCFLASPWNTLEHITPDLTVSVQAVKDESNSGHFIVNSTDGFFVTNPDQLISGTTVVGAMFCRRRGVLQEMFRAIDADNQQMHIGTLAHEIFQQCLTDEHCTSLEHVREKAESWLTSSKTVSTLYAYKLNTAEAFDILEPYINEIAIFLAKHVHGREGRTPFAQEGGKREQNDTLTIVRINDIEENIWCHQLGIKGRIDATVSVTNREPRTDQTGDAEVMPLELKTGRASYSFEHSGQLALYELMMNLVGHRVQSGLLVYLRDGKVTRMVGNRNTRRDLIMLRNEIAYYIDRWMIRNESTTSNPLALPLLPALPEPINNQRACVKCPYNTVCTVMVAKEPNQPARPESHGLALIANEASGHLTNSVMDYFILWTGLIYLEREESLKDYAVRKIWTKTPEERVQKGWCMAGLTLLDPVCKADDSYYHHFSIDSPTAPPSHNDSRQPGASGVFEAGEYVVCSTYERVAVAAGHIISYSGSEIIASFERDLSVNYSGEKFLLDRSDPYKSAVFNWSSLAMLLANSDEANRLRRIIVDREVPTFTEGILPKPMVPVAKKLLERLNRHQKIATLKAASADSYCLLKGLPGTGKTETIVGLIRLLVALGQTVLLTSNTHSAVDNVLKRLAQAPEPKFIRLGSLDRIDPAIRPFSATELGDQCTTPEQLSQLYEQFKVVAVTCLGTSHPLMLQRTFDYCIVDEATQVFQSSVIRPLLRSRRFLLVGDPEQLPPVIRSNTARSLGATDSLFHRLDQPGAFCILPTQYRMNSVLTKLANDFTYDGNLVCGSDAVANSTLALPDLGTIRHMFDVEKWVIKTISNQLALSAVALDTGNSYQLHVEQMFEEKEAGRKTILNCKNIPEAALVAYICSALLRAGVMGSSIGVIAPFRAQVELIQQRLRGLQEKIRQARRPLSTTQLATSSGEHSHEPFNDISSIEVNTVDQFQGKDKKLIIYSCTRTLDPDTARKLPNEQSNGEDGNEILNDKRRLTVAITRAKEKLILVGDWTSLDAYPPFKKLANVLNTTAFVTLHDQKYGFNWQNVLDTVMLFSDDSA